MNSNFKNAAIMALILTAIFSLSSAFAGSDTTFGAIGTATTPVGMIEAWLKGSMGRLFAIGALAIGLGVGIVKQSIMSVAVGVDIALSASMGPGVLALIVTGVL